MMQGFEDLLTLRPDWDTCGAPSSGGLQLEWHRKEIDLEVVFDRVEQPFFHYRNRLTGDESERALPEDGRLLASIVGSLE